MTLRNFRYCLWFSLFVCSIFAAWAWYRPYAWNPDPAARCEIVETLVTRDQSFFWVNVHLKLNPGMTHDLQKTVRLETSGGAMHEPADTTFAGTETRQTTDIWFKFWLEPADLTGPLALHLNGGKLLVKAGGGAPVIGESNYRNFTSTRW